MLTVSIRRILSTVVKYEFSIKNCTVLFKEVLMKKDFVLGLFDQKSFFKGKINIFLLAKVFRKGPIKICGR